MFNRHYRAAPIVVLFMRFVSVTALLAGLIIVFSAPSSGPRTLFLVCYYAVMGFMFVRTEFLLRRVGMYESDEGLRFGSRPHSRQSRWQDIERFEPVPGSRDRVRVVHHNGTTYPANTAQGARIRWNGGETHDIVGELNARLSQWRDQH